MFLASSDIEKSLWEKGYKLICGIDEVGRGCFAGPVVAGAVIFPNLESIPEGLADSKLLSAKKREELAVRIKNQAIYWSVGEIGLDIINEQGIGKATQLAFLEAVKNLKVDPDYIVIDAFVINGIDPNKQKAIISGDRICTSIAASSIIAKVYRDDLMVKLSRKYPEYGFDKHKGYGTKIHRDAIKKHGLSPIHRTSFNLNKFL